MRNLIKNDQWFSQENNKILYFTNTGPITYDKFCMNNFRFCSLTMTGGTASNRYEPLLLLHHARLLRFGYHMRAITIDQARIEVLFFDCDGNPLMLCHKNITADIDTDFHDACAEFAIPQKAAAAKLALSFNGNVTACTFGMPFAELY